MSTDVLGRWPEWREKLIVELRSKDIPGKDIGDILTEVATHVAETEEPPAEAFGDPAASARRRAETVVNPNPPHPYLGLTVGDTVAYIASAAGGLMAAGAAWAFGAGDAR